MTRAATALLTPNCQPGGSCGMTCRRRTFTNLTADQLALARDGVISQSLRAASPVFFWQTTRQRRSRREAICSKNTAWHAITFGSHGEFADLARMKCRRAALVRPAIATCTNLTLQDLPPRWAKANGATRGSRGAGYWRWKPYTLLRRLQALGDGEVLVHLDYDLAIGRNLSALFCLGQNAPRGVAAFHFPCWTDRGWTKRELADAFNATDRMLDTAQLYAGLLVLRKTPFALRFLQQWLHWSTTAEHITDAWDPARQYAGFQQHRHDQSILSLLAKRHGLKTFPLPTAAHDTRDIWAWDAGYCDVTWPLPTYRPATDPYVTHYKEMGGLQDSMRHCEKTQGFLAPLADYVQSEQVLRSMRAYDRLGEAQQRLQWRPAQLRGMPQCAAALVRQESTFKRSRCVGNHSFGCFLFDGLPHIWIANGCRGVFACHAGGASRVTQRCGRAGNNNEKLNVCTCEGEL